MAGQPSRQRARTPVRARRPTSAPGWSVIILTQRLPNGISGIQRKRVETPDTVLDTSAQVKRHV